MLKTFCNETAEVHALIHGFYCGLTEWKGMDDATLQNEDVIAEIHYARGGYIFGTLLRISIIAWFGCEYLA